jgi:DMSO/TMAO reductase YedYZ molybdopterin-dependent catalytic subunit
VLTGGPYWRTLLRDEAAVRPLRGTEMTMDTTRREVLKGGLAAAGLAALGIPEWALPALAQDESLVAFTDLPPTVNTTPGPDRRVLDIRTIQGPLTPTNQWFTIQHYGHPKIDPAAFRLRIAGLVNTPLTLTVDELRKMKSTEITFGFECSGNRRPLQGLVSCGRWTGVPLRAVLDRAGVKPQAREFVFFGADQGPEDVEFRGQITKVEQQFGRSLPRDLALSAEPMIAYAMNGEPLTVHQGAPLRLIVPGWYGVANVKWLAEIHVQEDAYLGKWQARNYRTHKGEMVNGEMKWKESAISHMRLKSFIARVTRAQGLHRVLGVILHDGTPIKSVEVKVDEGPWQAATIDPATGLQKYSWKLFTYIWKGAAPGEHTLVSRVTDANGLVQPTEQDLANKKTFLEDNSQHPRKVMIA